MADLGFWALAEADPGKLALVTPEGEEVTAGALLAESNRLVHGLRALGLTTGDAIAVVLPNSVEFMALYLAALQAGFYLVPINTHLVGPEIAHIVSDSEAKVFIGHERLADACAAAAEELDFPKEGRFVVGDVGGFRAYAELTDGQPDTSPPDRTTGMVMNYTSGTTGKPKGVRRPLMGIPPEAAAISFGGMLLMFQLQPHDDNVHIVGSPLYHTAVLVFAGGALHMAHTVVLMDKWTPEGMLQLIEKYRVTNSHMVPTQFHRLLALPDEVR
ncbi:MAG: AMP-binding protein, partial [Acidimicrobiales bacterium]